MPRKKVEIPLYNVFIFIEGKYPSMFEIWIIEVQKGKELATMMHYVWCLDVVRRNEDLSMFENWSLKGKKGRRPCQSNVFVWQERRKEKPIYVSELLSCLKEAQKDQKNCLVNTHV